MHRWDITGIENMKKNIFMFVALCATVFANAQITLEHTINGYATFPYTHGTKFRLLGNIIHSEDANGTYITDAITYSTKTLPAIPNVYISECAAKGYFTADDRICFIAYKINESQEGTNNYQHIYLYDEYGTMIQDLGTCKYFTQHFFALPDGPYKYVLIRTLNEKDQTEIYSLPGNGESQAINNPSPKKNARKFAREGHVLVETETNTYTLNGQEVK